MAAFRRGFATRAAATLERPVLDGVPLWQFVGGAVLGVAVLTGASSGPVVHASGSELVPPTYPFSHFGAFAGFDHTR